MPDTALIDAPAGGVRRAQREDADRLLDILTLAFAADPATRWLFPDPQQYLDYFPRFARAFGGGAIAQGTAFVSRGFGGAALWLAPDSAPDEAALGALLEESVADREKETAFAVFAEMGRYHPEPPHWYLPLIGVDPVRQGRGHGAALLKAALRLCDAERRPAYLEATSLRSVSLYQAHGFEPVGRIGIGACPPIVPMLRPAR